MRAAHEELAGGASAPSLQQQLPACTHLLCRPNPPHLPDNPPPISLPCRHDAGDYIKHSLTTAQAALFLATAALDFSAGHNAAGQAAWARAAVKWAADYLVRAHQEPRKFVGLVADPAVDHNTWIRPEDQVGAPWIPRRIYAWTAVTPASDLTGTVRCHRGWSLHCLSPLLLSTRSREPWQRP